MSQIASRTGIEEILQKIFNEAAERVMADTFDVNIVSDEMMDHPDRIAEKIAGTVVKHIKGGM